MGLELGQPGIGALLRGEDLGGQVGVGRQVLQHGRHPQRMPGGDAGSGGAGSRRLVGRLHLQDIADRPVAVEVLAGHGPGDHHRVRLLERRRQVPRQGRQGKHGEDGGIDPGEIPLGDRDVGGPAAHRGQRLHQTRGDDAGKHRPQLAGDGGLGGVVVRARGLARRGQIVGDLVDLLVAGQPAVVAELVADELGDQDRRGEGDRQSQDADPGIEPVARQVVHRRGEIVAEHGPDPLRLRAGFPRPPARRAG